jgi:5'-AMP-activated protein kinase regulatory beta subunit
MGTVSSVSKDINNYKVSDSQDDSSEYEAKAINSLKKINSKYQSQGQSETRDNTKVTMISEQKIRYKFEWKEGGDEVKIAGSFLDNWNKREEMKKNLSTGIYEIELEVPRGIHEFKFIVDKKWVCSQFYKIINDQNNNANNIIDLTNYIVENNSSIKKKKKKSGKEHIEYNCNFPNFSEVNVEAPGLPSHYIPCFNLNFQTKQENFKSFFKQSLFLNKSKTALENDTFKTIVTISHEKLSHICYNTENNNDNNEKYIRTCTTQRNKHKFITIVYYTPKK